MMKISNKRTSVSLRKCVREDVDEKFSSRLQAFKKDLKKGQNQRDRRTVKICRTDPKYL